MKVYEALAAACRGQGADVAFGLVGDGNVKFVHAWTSGGALLMSPPDLETAGRHEIPVVVVVMNDRVDGSEFAILSASGLPPGVGLFRNPSFAQAAGSMGGDGITVTSLHDLGRVRERLQNLSGPLVMDCQLNADVRGPWLEGAFNRSLGAP